LPYPAGIGVSSTVGTAAIGAELRIEMYRPAEEDIYIIEMVKKTKPTSKIAPITSGSIIKVTPGPIIITFD
jgi:hypothetical protein